MNRATARRRRDVFGFVAALVVCAGILVTGSGAAGRHTLAPSVTVTPGDFSVAVTIGGRHVTTFGGTTSPFVYWTTQDIPHHATQLIGESQQGSATTYTVASTEPGRTLSITVVPHASTLELTYSVSDPATVEAVGLSLSASPHAHYLGTGQRVRWVDMQGTVDPLKANSDCQSSSPNPFFVSTSGLGAWASTWAVGRIAFPGAVDDSNFACSTGAPPCPVGAPANAVRFCFKSAKATITVASGPLKQLLTQHATAVGLPRAPWLPQLALIKWRDRIAGPKELFDDISALRARKIPIGWILLDNPWEQGASHSSCYGALKFDSTAYPNPKQMIARIHSRGVRFMLWISPQINKRIPCSPEGFIDGWMSGNDKTSLWDLTLPAARSDYVKRLTALVDLGVDGFKGDRGDEVNLEPDTLAGGPGTVYQNLYPLLYDRAAAKALESKHGSSFATMFRSFVPGSSSVLPGFVGPDAQQDFDGMRAEIRAGQTAGVSGAPVWGADIGGYAGGGPLTSTIFVRWAQYAALTPIFEVGGTGLNATFWQLGAGAVNGFRAAATLHYELVPYLYSLAQAASRTGLPVIRPLGLEWPSDQAAWAHDLELTVGDSLLAAPVNTTNPVSRVYLPAGTWVDVFSGKRIPGGRAITRRSGPEDFPLYLRAGDAVPFSFRAPRVWASDWGINDLLRDGRQGWLVAPALGSSSESVPDRGSTLSTRSDRRGHVQLTLHRPLPEQQLLVDAPLPVCHAAMTGHVLHKALLASLPARRSAWAVDGREVVIKITNARDGTRVELAPC